MIIMITLGIGVFLGFNMEWVSLNKNTEKFLSDTHFADYRIVNENGFSKSDLEKLSAVEGVDKASRYISVNAEVKGTANTLGLTVTENREVSFFTLMSGDEYDSTSEDGMWLFDKYAQRNNVKIGDPLTVTYKDFELTGTVRGLIESGEYMICVRDETQLMPDFNTYGYVYVSPVMLKNAVIKKYGVFGEMAYDKLYPQINVLSDLSKSQITEKTERALGKTLLILSKNETISYSEAKGEEEEGKTMGLVLPVVFLAIAVLTMVTTMHRLTVNEKTQIGTLKALGVKDGKISAHYTSYALFIGVIGSLLGLGLGYFVCWFMLNPDGMMGTYIVMPEWKLYLPWWCALVVALIVGFLTLIGYLSVKKMLSGTASDALRPYTPKKFKNLLIEKNKLWNKLSFGTKWNLRDLFRHKSRSFMTLIGLIGCMVLLVGALGMNDTATGFINVFYQDVMNYETRIYLSSDGDKTTQETNAVAYDIASKTNGDYSASISVTVTDEPISLDVYGIRSGVVGFLSDDSKLIKLPTDGALVCMRVAKDYNLKIGDEFTVSPYGTSEKYTMKVAGFNRSLSKSISVSEEYAKTLQSDGVSLTDSSVYRINSVYVSADKETLKTTEVYASYKDGLTLQSHSDIVKSFEGFMDILNLAIVVLIVFAVVLGVVVLYNLGVMSYTERYREMATLKVVGFYDKQIGKLLITQNLWLTVVGVAIGLFAGIGVLNVLMIMLASEYEMQVVLGPITYVVSILLTFGVSLIVGLMVSAKNKKINMVEALKGAE
ncbi:MAG: FtsX-like permease family protein [Clostridia bacterium]|nr:FtsX-like permease family protein [Clostridia bacterium]